jgi:hypothetical protein
MAALIFGIILILLCYTALDFVMGEPYIFLLTDGLSWIISKFKRKPKVLVEPVKSKESELSMAKRAIFLGILPLIQNNVSTFKSATRIVGIHIDTSKWRPVISLFELTEDEEVSWNYDSYKEHSLIDIMITEDSLEEVEFLDALDSQKIKREETLFSQLFENKL